MSIELHPSSLAWHSFHPSRPFLPLPLTTAAWLIESSWKKEPPAWHPRHNVFVHEACLRMRIKCECVVEKRHKSLLDALSFSSKWMSYISSSFHWRMETCRSWSLLVGSCRPFSKMRPPLIWNSPCCLLGEREREPSLPSFVPSIAHFAFFPPSSLCLTNLRGFNFRDMTEVHRQAEGGKEGGSSK